MIRKIFICIILMFLMVSSVYGYPENFQEYSNNNFTSTWQITGASSSVVTYDGSYNRAYSIDTGTTTGSSRSATIKPTSFDNSPSLYWSFKLPYVYRYTVGYSISTSMHIYNENGSLIWTYTMSGCNQCRDTTNEGFWELVLDGMGNVTGYRNGVSLGDIGGQIVGSPRGIGFTVSATDLGSGNCRAFLYIDDISTSGDYVTFNSESYDNTVSESNLQSMSASYTIKSGTHTASEYILDIKRLVNGNYTDIENIVVKSAGSGTPVYGDNNFNRDINFTINDTIFGTYYAYLKKAGSVVASTTFILQNDSMSLSAFNDSFQYYYADNYSLGYNSAASRSGTISIENYEGTNNKVIKINSALPVGGGPDASSWIKQINSSESDYWSFDVAYVNVGSATAEQGTVYLYDDIGTQIWSGTLYTHQSGTPSNTVGLWELFYDDSDDSIYARYNGVDKGRFGTFITEQPYKIGFRTYTNWEGGSSYHNYMWIDDISTEEGFISIARDSINYSLNVSEGNEIDIKWSIKTIPFIDFNSSNITLRVLRDSVELFNKSLKTNNNITVMQGIESYNRSLNFTINDTIFGTYYAKLYKDDIEIASDYFLYISPMIFQSLDISPSEIHQRDSVTITAWITGVSDSTSVKANVWNVNSNPVTYTNVTLSNSGSDIYIGTYSSTLEEGTYYIPTVYADSSEQDYELTKSFLVRYATGGGSGGGDNGDSNDGGLEEDASNEEDDIIEDEVDEWKLSIDYLDVTITDKSKDWEYYITSNVELNYIKTEKINSETDGSRSIKLSIPISKMEGTIYDTLYVRNINNEVKNIDIKLTVVEKVNINKEVIEFLDLDGAFKIYPIYVGDYLSENWLMNKLFVIENNHIIAIKETTIYGTFVLLLISIIFIRLRENGR